MSGNAFAATAHPRLASRRPRLLAAALAGALASGLLIATPVQAGPARPEPLRGQVEKLDKDGGEVHGAAATFTPKPSAKFAEPVWPAGKGQVTLPAKGAGKAGALPITVGRANGAAGQRVSAVSVEVLDRAVLPPQWRAGVLARVASTTGDTGGAAVTIDYHGFQHAYGAGWASRLRLWSLPECALTTPQRPGCSPTALQSRNNPAMTTVTGEAPVRAASQPAGSGALIMLAAAPAGPSGDFTATPLAPSSTWSTGGSSGGFTWSYPMRAPAVMGGPDPKMSLNYSSASVDGRSSATNNQPSWIGEGFEYWPGYIERRYIPCSEDKTGTPNNPPQTGDLCWRSDNATMSLNGGGNELIYESGKGWHGRSEDGSKVEKLTGGSNGDNNGEYWKVTTTDGTQYFFGLNSLPGQTATTESAWTAPVYGNHTGEPCHATAFTDSDCPQAWRWNLDYVIDVHGNTLSYWYAKEQNKYAAEVTASKATSYTRGGYLARAEYGTWDRGAADRSVTPTAKVEFAPGDRCLSTCATHDATHWPDVPWDQECTGTSCTDQYSPTFWSTKRLAKITTWVWDTTKLTPAWQDVDSWTFGHGFPSPGDGSEGGLWLNSITHAGLVGGTATLPPVTFDPVALTNRVLTQTNTTNNWQRLAAIKTETGATIQVTYSLPECTATNLPSAPESNTKLCYPVIGPDPYSTSGGDITEWWHKYVVRQITETDVQLADGHQAPTKNTFYAYLGTPAWHYADDDGFTKPKYKTWNQFRGYATVDVQVGDSNKTLTRTTYLRGMHGDRAAPAGGTRTVTVGASLGSETVYDEDQFAGMVREQVVYNGTTDKPVSKTVSVPWRSAPTASRTINGDTATATYVNTRVTYEGTALGIDGAGGWRVSSSQSSFDDTYGTLNWAQDNGDTAKTGDEKCVSYTYNRNTAKNLTTLPRRVLTTTLTCDRQPTTPDHVISDAVTFYDGATDAAVTPVRGMPTRVDGLKDWNATSGTLYQTVGQSTFDAFGREVSTTDVKGNTTTTAFTPATGPATRETSSNQLSWQTITDKNPYWGLPTKVTDPNGRVTEVTYDPLGRVSAVWEIGWSKTANPDLPSSRYTYAYAADRSTYPYIKTESLNAVGNYTVSYDIFDAFLRPRQTQTTVLGAGERVVTDTLYDTYGRAETVYRAHAEPGDPSGTLWWEPEWSVPAMTRTVYDRANRERESVFLSGDGVTNLVTRWRTTTTPEGDRTTVVPPSGGTASTTITDAQGRTIELRQYTTASGPTGAYDTTRYAYNSKDRLTKVTDPAGNEWTYEYDVKGRRTGAVDPDRGRTTTTYNDYNEITETSDTAGHTLQFAYDTLGRKTTVSEPPVAPATTPTKRAEWIYDRLYTGVTIRGQLTQHIRYDGANAYKWQARGFNTRYQVTGDHYVIPASETGLAGTYIYGYGYSAYNGAPTSVSYPAGADLAAEQVTTGYDQTTGLPRTLTSAWSTVGSLVSQQQYTSYGEPTLTEMKISGGVYAQEATTYDTSTRRTNTVKVLPETAAGTVSDRTFAYEDAGNIVGITDAPQVGATDRQCFRNNSLGQLTSAWTPNTAVDCKTATPSVATLGGPAPYWLDWTIDKSGNRTTETSHAGAGDTVRSYTLPTPGAGTVRPHAATAMTTTAPGRSPTTTAYGYDTAGNMTTRPGTSGNQTLTWDAESRLAKVTQGTTTLEENLYDAEGERLIRRDPGGTTLFLPGMEIRRASTSALTATRYYTFASRTVASRTSGNQTLTWLFTDHQGTQHLAINAYTQQVSVRRQTPYGEPRGTQPAWPNNKGFVDGDNDPTGLVHIGARDYDAALGRFVTVDPLQDLSDPQQWNPYSYASNTPISASDPTGLRTDYYDPVTTTAFASDRKAWEDYNRKRPAKVPPYVPRSSGKTNGGQKPTIDSGVSDEDVRLAQEIKKKNALNVIVEAGGKILMEFFGINDIMNCATKGDIGACAMTLVNFLPWGKIFKAVKTIPVIARAGRAILKWMDDVKWADDVLAKAETCLTHSFRPSTRVLLSNGKAKQIKDVKVGDKVRATDPTTGRSAAKTVTVTHSHEDTYLTRLTVHTAAKRGPPTTVIWTTQNHPIWDETTKSWIKAGQLVPGKSVLRSNDGDRQVIAGVLNYTGRQNMRDLTVADIHTYYVLAGDVPVLVHNCPASGDYQGKHRSPDTAADSDYTGAHREGLLRRAQNGISDLYNRHKFAVQEGLRSAYDAQEKFSDTLGRDAAALPEGSWASRAAAGGRIAAGAWGFTRGYLRGRPPSIDGP